MDNFIKVINDGLKPNNHYLKDLNEVVIEANTQFANAGYTFKIGFNLPDGNITSDFFLDFWVLDTAKDKQYHLTNEYILTTRFKFKHPRTGYNNDLRTKEDIIAIVEYILADIGDITKMVIKQE